jgi:hypothetical protein
MRIIFTILLFVGCISAFAEHIPAGSKSISMSSPMFDYTQSGNHFDLGLEADLNLGYFFFNNLEVFFSLGEPKLDDSYYTDYGKTEFDIGLGFYYHYPFNNNFSVFSGASLVHGAQSLSNIPFDLGVEVFLVKNAALRITNRFLYYFDDIVNEAKDNTIYLKFGLAVYI